MICRWYFGKIKRVDAEKLPLSLSIKLVLFSFETLRPILEISCYQFAIMRESDIIKLNISIMTPSLSLEKLPSILFQNWFHTTGDKQMNSVVTSLHLVLNPRSHKQLVSHIKLTKSGKLINEQYKWSVIWEQDSLVKYG